MALRIGPADAKPTMKDPYKVREKSELAKRSCFLETSIGIEEDSVGTKNCPNVFIKKVFKRIKGYEFLINMKVKKEAAIKTSIINIILRLSATSTYIPANNPKSKEGKYTETINKETAMLDPVNL